MNTKCLSVLLLAFFANLNGFESADFSDFNDFSPASTNSFSSPGSTDSGRMRMFDLVEDRKQVIKRLRSGIDGDFWNAIDREDFQAAKKLKNKKSRRSYKLDVSNSDNIDNISILLGSDDTSFETLEFLYKEYPQVFRDYGKVEGYDNPFYYATQRNIDYLTEKHSDDAKMIENIQKADQARRSEMIDGAIWPW